MLEESSSGSTIGSVRASHMKKALAGISAGLAILGSGFLAPLSETDVAVAAMAPSLMQDEKGYISIFEKVRVLGSLSVSCRGEHSNETLKISESWYVNYVRKRAVSNIIALENTSQAIVLWMGKRLYTVTA